VKFFFIVVGEDWSGYMCKCLWS